LFEARFLGRRLTATKSAHHELLHLSLDLFDVAGVLENGCDCAKSRRACGKMERCFQVGRKVLRVVVAEDYNEFLRENVFVVIHVSMESLKRGRFVK
jgi:hypothetical protein